MRRLKAAGLTLVELAVTLAVLAVIMTLSVPFMARYVADSRLSTGAQMLFASAVLAQSEAIKRSGTVSLLGDGARLRIVDTSVEPHGLIREHLLPGQVTVGQARRIDFNGMGRPAPFGVTQRLGLQLAGICQPGQDCPVLEVDPGGAVRLCGPVNFCR